jgi:hypothetical protein
VLAAISAGKHVVTANKQLLAQHGEELYAAAREAGVQLRFEGAVAGVVPVVRVLMESLAGARISRIHGIVNGTSNFILSEMARLGWSYEQALAEAQRLGYAEADPSEDVNGKDAAAKMAILARLAFDVPVHLDQVRYEGIEHITADDLQYARDFDLGLKLVGTAERLEAGISVRVHPLFLSSGHPLAAIGGSFNAVTLEGEEITASAPSRTAADTAQVIPRSLNEPVGFSPSSLRWTSAPTASDSLGANSSGVDPSWRETIGSSAANGSRSPNRSIRPVIGRVSMPQRRGHRDPAAQRNSSSSTRITRGCLRITASEEISSTAAANWDSSTLWVTIARAASVPRPRWRTERTETPCSESRRATSASTPGSSATARFT